MSMTTADPKDDPKQTVGGYVSYRSHICPLCKAVIYDEIYGVKLPPHHCPAMIGS